MRSFGTISYRSNALFLNGGVGKCFTVCMLAIPDGLRSPVFEANHVMFPVANMVSDSLTENRRPIIVCIKIHINCVNVTGTVIVDNYRGADSSVCLAIAIRFDTLKPLWIRGYIIERG